MASQKSSFLEIDSKIIEKNLSFEECKSDLDKAFDKFNNVENAPWKLVTPKPGFCIKTVDSDKKKVFVNFCLLDEVPEPKDVNEDELLELIEARQGDDFRVPLSLQEPREELDKSGKPAQCFDVAVNPRFLQKAENSMVFKMFLIQITFDGLKDKFDIDLEVEDYVTLKNKKCMGTLTPHRIRTTKEPYKPPKPLIEDITTKKPIQKPGIVSPTSDVEYKLFKIEKEEKEFLCAEIHLPRTTLAKDVMLEIGVDRLIVESRQAGHLLDIFLPINLDQKTASAAFATSTRSLHVMAPVLS